MHLLKIYERIAVIYKSDNEAKKSIYWLFERRDLIKIKLNESPELTAASLLKKKMDVYAFIRYTRKAKSTTIDKIIDFKRNSNGLDI